MKKLVTIDFETYWESKGYSLSKMGPVEYIRDPRFNVQMIGANRGGETMVFTDPTLVRGFVGKLEDPDTVVIGHNLAGFDALILSEHFGVRPKHLWDTIAMANWTGVGRMGSRSHAAVTEFFGNGKKKAGTVVSDGKRWPDQFSKEEREFFMEYCRDDVSQCVANFARMLPYMTADALRFMSITARMATEPAFVLDADMLREYIAGIDGDVAAARQSLLDTFHYTNEESFLKAIRSPHDFAFMLRRLGVEPPKKVSEAKTKTVRAQFERDLASIREWDTDPATKAEAEQAILSQMDRCLPVMNYAFSKQDLDFLALREHDDPRVRELVNARLELNSSVNRSRAERLLCYAEHGKPIPITLAAFNAHTGRYTAGAADDAESSDRLQFQNLSKRDPAKAALRKAIKAPAGCSVVACDSSQVEARCLAWVAGETELVAQFAEGRDPYSELAETIFGVPSAEIKAGAKGGDKRLKTYRNTGKTCILSCLAGDTEVLTDTGWKRMDTVSINDKVWDGISWVTHEGLICNGWRSTINVGGISMTPDHLIFDGSSWSTGAALLAEPRCLMSATRWAFDAYRTAQSSQRTTKGLSGIKPLASIVGRLVGTLGTRWLPARWRNSVRIVSQEMQGILLGAGNANARPLTQRSEPCSASLPSLRMNGDNRQAAAGITVLSCGAVAVPNPIGFCNPIFATGEPHDVTRAPRRSPVKRRTKSIGSTLMSFLTRLPASVFSIALPLASLDAVRHETNAGRGSITAGEGYVSSSPTAERSFNILSRFRDMMTRCLSLTALTVMATTHRAISALSLEGRTRSIDDTLATCRDVLTASKVSSPCFNGASEPCSTNWQKVYDLKNCGPNSRFLIRKGTTVLMAHNCGYGVGAQKFADTLLRSGAKLDDDVAKHNELAFHAHSVYREANPNIVAFWRTCGTVLDYMLAGQTVQFGGPKGNLFTAGPMAICGGVVVPSVQLPSGYILRYPNLRRELVDCKNQIVYDRYKNREMVPTRIYGGALTENIIQAFAFQILMWQACRMDEAGISIKCNIHDSFATVVPTEQAESTAQKMLSIMKTTPPWAEGLPIDAEVEVGSDFTVC